MDIYLFKAEKDCEIIEYKRATTLAQKACGVNATNDICCQYGNLI